MNMEVQKKPGGLSGGMKALLIFLVLVIAAVGGFMAYKNHQSTIYHTDNVLLGLFDSYDYSAYKQEEDPEEYQAWLAHFQAVRDKKAFRRELERTVREMTEVGLANKESYYLHYQEDGGSGHWEAPREDRFGGKGTVGTYESVLNKAIPVLSGLGYEDEGLKNAVAELYTREKELILKYPDAIKEHISRDLGVACEFNEAIWFLNNWNTQGGSFYTIDVESIYSAEDLVEPYRQAIEENLKEGKLESLGIRLSDVSKNPLLRDREFFSPQEIMDIYTGGTEEVYAVQSGLGGYYDGQANGYGDFYCSSTSHRRGGQTFDMTEFYHNPGLWESIGPELRSYISDTNDKANERIYTVVNKRRGEDVPLPDIPRMAEAGYTYAVPWTDGSDYVFVSPDSVCLGDGMTSVVFGDFSEIYSQLEKSYAAQNSRRGQRLHSETAAGQEPTGQDASGQEDSREP